MNTQARRYFSSLDGIRGVAAIIVALHHLAQQFLTNDPFSLGTLAVDIFFVLSGVVIADTYDARLASNMSSAEFMKRRWLRLCPLFLLGFGISVTVSLLNSGRDLSHGQEVTYWILSAGLYLVFLPHYFMSPHHNAFPHNPPAWSLFYELIANFLYTIFFRFLTVPRLIIVAVVACAVYAAISTRTGTPDLGWGWGWKHNIGGLMRVLFSFAVGVIMSRLTRNATMVENNLMVWLILFLSVAMLVVPLSGTNRELYAFVTLSVFSPVIVYMGIRFQPTRSVDAFCKLLGAISYPLYVIHVPLIRLYSWLGLLDSTAPVSTMILFMVPCTILALGAHYLIDIPVRRWGASKLFTVKI